jgi:hypothetical protein
MMRTTLYEAAQVMLLHSAKWSWLKAWAMKIARPPRDEKGNRCTSATLSRDYASHLD